MRRAGRARLRLTPPEQAAFERAQRGRYLVAYESQWHLKVAWAAWCRVLELPLILVQPSRVFAAVSVDLEPARARFSQAGHGLVERVFQAVEASPWECGRHCARGRVPVEDADVLARVLVAFLAGEGGERWLSEAKA